MKPKSPSSLSPEGKKLFTKIAEEIEMDSAAEMLLVVLCESFDRRQEARKDCIGQQYQRGVVTSETPVIPF